MEGERKIIIFQLLFFTSFLIIATTLIVYAYPTIYSQCQVVFCHQNVFGFIMNLTSPIKNETICTQSACPDDNSITCYYYNDHLVIDRPYNISYIIVSMLFYGLATSILLYIFATICLSNRYKFLFVLSIVATLTGSILIISGHTYLRYCLVQSCQSDNYTNIFDLYLVERNNLYHNEICSLQACSQAQSTIACYLKDSKLSLNPIYNLTQIKSGYYFIGIDLFTLIYFSYQLIKMIN